MKKIAVMALTVLLIVGMLSAASCACALDLGDLVGGLESLFGSDDADAYGVGECGTVDGVSATLTDVMVSKGGSGYTPEAGNVFVICEFKVENNSSEELALSSLMCFSASFDGTTYAESLEALGVALFSGKYQLDTVVDVGKKFTGVVGYEVPEDWEELKIRFTPDAYFGDSMTFVANK